MDIKGEQVRHTSFGAGVVTGQTGTTVTVDFGEYGEKKFLYPTAFESFLELSEAATKLAVSEELRANREKRDAEKAVRDAQDTKRQTELRVAALAQKRAAAKKTAKQRIPAKPKTPPATAGE
jgi:hypothetical protein